MPSVSKLSIIKFLELAIAIACVGLQYHTMDAPLTNEMLLLVCGTFVGYLLILLALFAGYLLQTPINKRLDVFFSLIGCALFVASGAFIIQQWNDKSIKIFISEDFKTKVLSKGSLAIANGALFLIDAFFTVKD